MVQPLTVVHGARDSTFVARLQLDLRSKLFGTRWPIKRLPAKISI